MIYEPEYVDPPMGWRYGFPKRVDQEYLDMGVDKTAWYVKKGYPQKLVDEGRLTHTRVTYKTIDLSAETLTGGTGYYDY